MKRKCRHSTNEGISAFYHSHIMKKINIFIATLVALTTTLSNYAQTPPPYLDDTLPIEERITDALQRLTLEEKIAIIHAQSKFSSPGVARLGIPEVWCTDGPHGIRPEVMWDEWNQAGWTNDSCVAFPALTALAATWDTQLALLYGKSIGEEARYRNKNVLLGPGVNICRTPLNGRSFEYMGEDPLLASEMVVPYIEGVQSNGVAACLKHYALNNNEVNRHNTNVIVSDRALHEIYLPAFKAGVTKGKAWSIMGAYNYYHNQHCCHNDILLNKILKTDWQFDGVVISDWGGVHNTTEAISNGLDLEYGSWTNGLTNGSSNAYDNYYMAAPYLKFIKSGKVSTTELDDKVRRVLRLIYRTSMNKNRPFGSMNSEEHIAAARKIAAESIVLLKNKGKTPLLPIDINRTKHILVVGENAIKMMTVGGGSSSLKAQHEITPLQGLKNAIANNATITYCRGYVGDVSGEYNGVTARQNIADNRSEETLMTEAENEARKADIVIFIGGLNKSQHQDCEDADRTTYNLPYNQDELITRLAKANHNIVVVNISGNAVAMPWEPQVNTIVQSWYLGSEAGNALADVLLGKVNPSGRLPYTNYATLDQCGAHALNTYPGTWRNDTIIDLQYTEDIFVGYRYTDANNLKPQYPFGHGLSYTTFSFGKIKCPTKWTKGSNIDIEIPISNTGFRDGAEVIQVYVQDMKSSVVRPNKELKAFYKIKLKAGETSTAKITLTEDALKYFSEQHHEWIAESGRFKIIVATSATNIKDTTYIDYQ